MGYRFCAVKYMTCYPDIQYVELNNFDYILNWFLIGKKKKKEREREKREKGETGGAKKQTRSSP